MLIIKETRFLLIPLKVLLIFSGICVNSVSPIIFLNSVKSDISRKLIFDICGYVYFICGTTICVEFSLLICLRLSTIIPSSFNKITLQCFPISSTISLEEIISSISSKPSNSIITSLSKELVIMFFMRNPIKCFRRTIQKLGATLGLDLGCVVK